jgi:predicted TPR repeat methyltransferase
MTPTAGLFASALQHHQAGDLRQAELIYRQILQYDPHHGDSMHLLGVIAHQVGQNDLAVQYIRQALYLIPGFPAAHNNLGNALKGLGMREDAAACYREAIRLQPNYVEALSNLGILLREQGQCDEAVAAYRQALRYQPQSAMVHNNLGNALRDLGKLEEAAACYQQALQLAPQYPEAQNNMGIVLQDMGQTERAALRFREALRLKPQYAEAQNNLGVILAGHGRPEEARACYEQALELRPDYVDARRNLGLCLHSLGRMEEAAAQFREVLRLRPSDATATHLLNALAGSTPPERPSADYVASLFDGYAGHFDDHLVKVLNYRGPELLREALAPPAAPGSLNILDLGCGTGLCGVAFRDWARQLTGVDLSAKMMARARARGVYDELIHGDLMIPLQAAREEYDLIVAGDVLAYLGDLGPVFCAVRRALRPGGHLAFLVEAHQAEGRDYVLRSSGRYAHSMAYLRRLMAGSELCEVSLKCAVARTERGHDIECFVVVLQSGNNCL